MTTWLRHWRPATWTTMSLVGLIGMLLVDGATDWLFLAIACAPLAAGGLARARAPR